MSSTPDETNMAPRSWWVLLCHGLWIVLRYFWVGIVLCIIIGSVPTLFFLTIDTPLSHLYIVFWWNNWIVPHFPLAVLVTVGVVLLMVISWKGSQGSAERIAQPARDERSDVLRMLRKAYIDERTLPLQSAIKRIDLDLRTWQDLTLPTQLSTRRTGQTERPLSPGTTIVTAYDEAGRGMLILGEPEAGKSTLLNDLAQALLDRAEHDEKQRLPVILNLSSWGLKRLTLSLPPELSLSFSMSV